MTTDGHTINEGDKTAEGRKAAAPAGIAHVKVGNNNVIVTMTDMKGDVICWSTPGRAGFKGSRKSTPIAAQVAANAAAKQAIDKGMRQVEVKIKGSEECGDAAIRGIQAAGMEVTAVRR